ncbi:HNH endonuclease [Phreatobacter sp.]|uniref:HNH endonuclease n=1 Tax=Phreatobacter sp. TaxID=1966341 RepID=UPI003F6E65BA
MKMVNFASLDPTLEQKGMANASKLDRIAWDDFFSTLKFDDDREGGFSDVEKDRYVFNDQAVGLDVESLSKSRRGQSAFRKIILASYDNMCAISSITNEHLLVASHIDPWAVNADRRIDPTNGICLSSIFDRAFENGLVVIGDDWEVLVSSRLSENDCEKLRSIGSSKIRRPSKFVPDLSLFRRHREKFSGSYLCL